MLYNETRIILHSSSEEFRTATRTAIKDFGFTNPIFESDSASSLDGQLMEDKQAVVICDLRKRDPAIGCVLHRECSMMVSEYYCVLVRDQSDVEAGIYTGGFGVPAVEVTNEPKSIALGLFAAFVGLWKNSGTLCDRFSPAFTAFFSESDIEDCVKVFLNHIGMSELSVGSEYITIAICNVLVDSSLEHMFTKRLYVIVGKKASATPLAVERTMRRNITMTWEEMPNPEAIVKLYGRYHFRKKNGNPVTSEFIIASSQIVRERLNAIAVLIDKGVIPPTIVGKILMVGKNGLGIDVIRLTDLFRWLL